MGRAVLIIRDRLILADGGLISIRIWQVPEAVPPTTHGFKYSLFYGRPGERLVCYDNERGKGDHRHFQDTEAAYVFQSIEHLLADFWADVERVRRSGE